MSQFFTTLEKKESKFIGIVHDANTHQVLFRTPEQDTQELALNEVNLFVSSTDKTTSTINETTPPEESVVILPPPRRCCGR